MTDEVHRLMLDTYLAVDAAGTAGDPEYVKRRLNELTSAQKETRMMSCKEAAAKMRKWAEASRRRRDVDLWEGMAQVLDAFGDEPIPDALFTKYWNP